MSNLYKKIKHLREDRGISRREMSDLLGMTLNGYGKIERGEVEVTISRMYEIADILKVPINQFFEEETSEGSLKRKWTNSISVNTESEVSFDPFVYIEFLESRINYLKSQLSNNQ